jgi:uncharacterized protein YndB with AHSA1/START domain
MSQPTLSTQTHHTTLVFERTVPAPASQVFAAYADTDARVRWGAPSDRSVLIYDASDFSVGGIDRFRCGSKNDPKCHGTTWYHDIVPDGRIVSTEKVEADGQSLCVSLSTVEFLPAGAETRLKTTVQIASFVGVEMVKGNEVGHNASLDNLVRYFTPSNEPM